MVTYLNTYIYVKEMFVFISTCSNSLEFNVAMSEHGTASVQGAVEVGCPRPRQDEARGQGLFKC